MSEREGELRAATFELTELLPLDAQLVAQFVDSLVDLDQLDSGAFLVFTFSGTEGHRWELDGELPCDLDDLVRALARFTDADAVSLVRHVRGFGSSPLPACVHITAETRAGGFEQVFATAAERETPGAQLYARARPISASTWLDVPPDADIELTVEATDELVWGPPAEA